MILFIIRIICQRETLRFLNVEILNFYLDSVQVLSILALLLACSEDWTCNLQMIVSLEA